MRIISAVVVISFATLVGCTSGSDPISPAGSGGAPFEISGTPVDTTEVDLPRSYRFDPAVIEVTAGSTVTWTNGDDFPHNVHLLDGSDLVEDLPIGGSASITFDDPGTVFYECSIHPQQMHGKIEIT
jgi:plastocyanin